MKTNLLRLLVTVLLLLGAVPMVDAQSNPAPPGQISYQGFLTDANGNPLATNGPQNFTVYFKLWNDASATAQANLLWGEQQTVTVDRGFFTVLLGQGSAISGAPNTNNLTGYFNAADASSRFVGTTVLGISANEMAPRLRLLASPYSLLAANSLNASNSVNAANVTGTGTISLTNLAANSVDSSKIADNSIVNADISASAGIVDSKLATISSAGKVADSALSGNVALYNRIGTFFSQITQPQSFSSFNGNNSSELAVSLPILNGTGNYNLIIGVDVFKEISGISASGGGDAVILGPSGRSLHLQTSAGTAGVSIDANGRVGIGTSTPSTLLQLNGGANCNGLTWNNASDRRVKEKFAAINPRLVLEKLSTLQISEWQYKMEDAGTRHLGPVAQDFHALFGLNGADETHIATVDEEGVALAAIQGLNQKLEEKNAEIEKLKQSVEELRKMVQEIAGRK